MRAAPTRETARRLGLVTLGQMVGALVYAVEHPPDATRIVAEGLSVRAVEEAG